MDIRRLLTFSIALPALLVFLAAAPVGDLQANIKEYDVPTPKSRPHDPAVAPDGALWYTGQQANKLGRLDPATGRIKEYPLPVANSGPHGLVADNSGHIWYTANYAGYIGELDPSNGQVKQYKIPDPRAKDPHTPVFAPNGVLWFTVESGNFIGRLDPKSGKIDLKDVPTREAVPYGIVVTKDGMPVFCEFGSNKLATVDPKTMAIHEYELPARDARPRRIALAADGTVYFTDYGRGYLGHFDPKAGKLIEEWESPGGGSSRPYGITITPDGKVWYSESGVKPNTLVRFDPGTKAFAKMAIPSGGGVVRNMAATKDGRVYLACSGVNKVAIVTP